MDALRQKAEETSTTLEAAKEEGKEKVETGEKLQAVSCVR
jgi:hypothetical protein